MEAKSTQPTMNHPKSKIQNPRSHKALRFVLACCQAEPSDADTRLILSLIQNPTLNIQDLLFLSTYHGVLPLVYQGLKKISTKHSSLFTLSSSLERMLTELQPYYQSIARRNMLMSAELIKLMKLFKDHNIEILAFKGPVLAQSAYGDITLRRYGDLDLLLRREDFRTAARLMRERGYAPLFPIDDYRGDKVLFDLNNDCPFYDRKRGLAVELHWDFFRKLALPTVKLHPWDNPGTIYLNGAEIPTLNDESHLLYLSLHGSKHIYERLLWIVDLDRFVRAHPDLDWDRVETMARRMGVLKMLLFSLALSRHLLTTPLPDSLKASADPEDFREMIDFVESQFRREDPTPEESLVKLAKVVSLRDNLHFKTATALEFLFRPGINERRMVILPDRWAWLYWPLRPFGMGYRFVRCRLFGRCNPQEA